MDCDVLLKQGILELYFPLYKTYSSPVYYPTQPPSRSLDYSWHEKPSAEFGFWGSLGLRFGALTLNPKTLYSKP